MGEVIMATGAAMGAGKKAALAAMGMFSGVGVVTAYKLDQSVKADLTLHPPKLTWSHSGMIDSLDHLHQERVPGVQAGVRCLSLSEIHGLQESGGSPIQRQKLRQRLRRSKP